MTVSTFQQINSATQTVAVWPPLVDGNIAVFTRIADAFAPHAQTMPNLTMALDPGHIFNGATLTEVAAQPVGTFTAPVSNPRIDRVVIDHLTGVASIVNGTEAASPVPPTIPAGKLPVAQVLLQTSSTAITNNMITDERDLTLSGLGTGSTKNTGNTVVDPGTGSLEVAIPVSVQAGTSYSYVAADRGYLKRRSNSGAVMTDTLPGTSSGVMAAGWSVTIANDDAAALMSIAAGAGAVINGAPMGFIILGPSQRVTLTSDGANYNVVQMANRVRLGANATLYVSTTGSDSNTGIASGTPFLTVQKAVNFVASYYDLSGFVLTIQLADGTYTAGFIITAQWTGGGSEAGVIINGNSSTPSNVVISTAAAAAAAARGDGVGFAIQNLKLQTTSGYCLLADKMSSILFNNLVFGNTSSYHIYVLRNSSITCTGSYSIVGGANVHLAVFECGWLSYDNSPTVTLTGTPAFSRCFALVYALGAAFVNGVNYSGGATGQRYDVSLNGVLNTSGGGPNFLPGSTAGTTETGGQYA